MTYKIIVNGEPRKDRGYQYEFNYSSVKHIMLVLESGKLSIEFEVRSKKSAEEFFSESNGYFSEAMKKGMLFHLLLYSNPLPENNIKIFINNIEIIDWNGDKSPFVFSLITNDLEPELSPAWKKADAVYQYFCKRHKSRQKELAASLYAFLYSKSKDNFTERFLYLWIAMNGLYSHLTKMKDPNNRNESEKISFLERSENWGTEAVTRNNRNKLGKTIDLLFADYGFGTDEFYAALKKETSKFPSKKSPYDITLDGYLNLWYPYYLRCNMFHAGKPIALFALANEFEIRCLEYINKRLDSYLDNNLWKYFDEDYCKEKIDNISREDGK